MQHMEIMQGIAVDDYRMLQGGGEHRGLQTPLAPHEALFFISTFLLRSDSGLRSKASSQLWQEFEMRALVFRQIAAAAARWGSSTIAPKSAVSFL